ncbi:GntR family transcriptional regulator [Streptomyces sp. SID13588]|uniref:GntR family transcriptional regulator n=1 Tax=Streptomyces sp. SID13588 TaxID=2706051 RepID=UPI0013CCFB76|nr:GntR family transcriptional regulator [Streptomyces sp. SID13588]NEA72789.1 GntR family transcriptional regulator [Streptomyces sp. SID13588]
MTAVSDLRPKPVRLADTMRDRIKEGSYPDGKLPTVKEMTKDFGYAGQTVRDGMAILIGEGLVISAGSRGYFIASGEDEATDSKPEGGEEIKEMRLQMQALTERVAALEELAGSDGAGSGTTMQRRGVGK